MQFQKATKKMAKARVALAGPSGAGKTYSALIAATVLAQGGKVAVIDTERGSASLYSETFDFDVLELNTYSPKTYTEAIHAAEKAGYAVIVIDSLSHAWEGEGGALDMLDQFAGRSGNQFSAWKDVTPVHRRMVDAMLQSPCHVVVTMRSKMDYVQEKNKDGKTEIRKVGMNPIQRAGMEYEFTLVVDLDINHKAVVSKSRCSLMDDKSDYKPGPAFWQPFLDWLNSGEAVTSPPPATEMGHTLDGEKPEYHTASLPNGRPWEPDKLREVIVERVGQYRTKSDSWQAPPPDGLRGAMVGALDKILGGDEARHTFLRVLFGAPSSKGLDHAQVKVIMEWLDSQAGPDVIADEAQRVVNAEIYKEMVEQLI